MELQFRSPLELYGPGSPMELDFPSEIPPLSDVIKNPNRSDEDSMRYDFWMVFSPIAMLAVEYYNEEHPDAEIELLEMDILCSGFKVVNLYASPTRMIWHHCNFFAKTKNDNNANVIRYFAELNEKSDSREFCCTVVPILDTHDTINTCYYCKESDEVLHPRHGFQMGVSELMPPKADRYKKNAVYGDYLSPNDLCEAVEKQNAKCARQAVEFVNATHPDLKMELEKAISSSAFLVLRLHIARWYHCNFTAKIKNENHPRLFFAELNDKGQAERYQSDFVCRVIVLGDETAKASCCCACGKTVIHPRDGYFEGIECIVD